MVAGRSIAAGEIIIDAEEPIVVGPKQATYPVNDVTNRAKPEVINIFSMFQKVCLTCYRRVDGSYLCSRCRWPLCSQQCQELPSSRHFPVECELLTAQQIHPSGDELAKEDCQVYDCITPLRLVLAAQQDAEKRDVLASLEHHQRHRQAVGIWHVDRMSVVDPILTRWGLAGCVSEEELQTACGILEVNAFEVCDEEEGGVNARAVYPAACLMAHDCVPNSACSVDPITARMSVRAAVDITAGQMITTSYTFTLDGTHRRRTHLKEVKRGQYFCEKTEPTFSIFF